MSDTVFSCLQYALSLQLLQRPVVVRDGEGTSDITMVWKKASRISTIYVDSFLSLDRRRAGVTKNKSLIRDWPAGFGTFAVRPFVQVLEIGYFYGSLEFTELHRRHKIKLTSDERLIKITRETIQKWVSHLHEKVENRDTVEHDASIVPAPFCAMRYIKDDRYLPGDEAH